MRNIKYCILLLFAALVFIGCEKLEDTYSDYSGNGAIRYLGKCSDFEALSGWNRVELNWENSVDPVVEKIIIEWTLGGIRRDTILSSSLNSCNIKNLSNGNYNFNIYAIDAKGNRSLEENVFARPYTNEHEVIKTFSTGFTKSFFFNGKLIISFDKWASNLTDLSLTYFDKTGLERNMKLTEDIVNKKYLVVEEIDLDEPILINRMGVIAGCPDIISFIPLPVTDVYKFSSEFKLLIKTLYGVTNITKDFVNSIEVIDIDYDITSFEDLLYFSNLKTLNLGKNRYFRKEVNNNLQFSRISELIEKEKSLITLELFQQHGNLDVNIYKDHFFSLSEMPSYFNKFEIPTIPDYSYISPINDGWSIRNSVPSEPNFPEFLEYLIDNNILTAWTTKQLSNISRSYVIDIDMKKVNNISGVMIAQKKFDIWDFVGYHSTPGLIKIELSKDNIKWESIGYVEDYILGIANGEQTVILSKPEVKSARYIKLSFNDCVMNSTEFLASLSEISLF